MWTSLQIRSDDKRTTLPAGRWPEHYVPRFHLAQALFELGCHRQACEQLQLTLLKALAKEQPEKYKNEMKQMELLETQCAANQKSEHESDWICRQWVCLLQQDRRSAP